MPFATLTATVTIDCDNLDCITFVDTTGEYSESNTTGYGGGNTPSLEEITYVVFTLVYGSTSYSYSDSGYLPNAAGDESICLTAENFGLDSYEIGETYQFTYRVFYGDEGGSRSIVRSITFPCCGEAALSNLATNFTITEKLGCGSIDFEDTTGTYDATTNPGGYGTPNPTYEEITSTTIVILKPDGTTVTITSFIPTEDDPIITLTAEDLGYTDNLMAVGVYTFTYSVYTGSECRVGYKTSQVQFHCQVRSCIVGKIQTLLSNDCSPPKCNDDNLEVNKTLALVFQYEAILLASQQNIGCTEGDMQKLLTKCQGDCPTC